MTQPVQAGAVPMPRQFTDRMQAVWQNAFHAQLCKRHKQRFNPNANPLSAEEAAWNALVKHCSADDASATLTDELTRLREKAEAVVNGASRTYRKRNGHQGSIEADDGEACEIVHSDLIFDLRQALADQPK